MNDLGYVKNYNKHIKKKHQKSNESDSNQDAFKFDIIRKLASYHLSNILKSLKNRLKMKQLFSILF